MVLFAINIIVLCNDGMRSACSLTIKKPEQKIEELTAEVASLKAELSVQHGLVATAPTNQEPVGELSKHRARRASKLNQSLKCLTHVRKIEVDGVPVTAPQEPCPLPGSVLTSLFGAHLLIRKFCYHSTIYHEQWKLKAAHGIIMRPTNLNLLILATAAVLAGHANAAPIASANFTGLSASGTTTVARSGTPGVNEFTWSRLGSTMTFSTPSVNMQSGTANALKGTIPGASTFEGMVGTMASSSTINIGQTLTLSFIGQYTENPANNFGGLRFGFVNSGNLGNAFGMQIGTGGSTHRSILRGGDNSPLAGTTSAIPSVAGGNAVATVSTSVFTASFAITRTDTNTYSYLGDVNGSTLSAAGIVGGFDNFNAIFIRNGSNSADVQIDSVSVTIVPDPPTPTLTNFTYDRLTGDAQVNLQGNPSTAYILVEADDLDFNHPDQLPIPLIRTIVGTLDADHFTTDSNGQATVRFRLDTGKAATFLRAEQASIVAMEVVVGRLLDSLQQTTVNVSEVDGFRSILQTNGSWPDIDYNSTGQSIWPPGNHLNRLRSLALAYSKAGSPYAGDAELLAEALKALDFWLADDPQSSNWWFNEIFTPQRLGEIMLMLEPHLSATQRSAGLVIMQRAYIARSINSGGNTGVNRTDRAYASMMRGLLAGDEALVNESYLAISDTILLTTNEGIQPDYSYHQHGAQLYIKGYGSSYASSLFRYGIWAAGSSFAFSPGQREILIDYLLDGAQWFLRGDTCDFTAAGREVTRIGQASTGGSYRSAVNNAVVAGGGYRLAEMQAFADRLNEAVSTRTANPNTALIGHRHFRRSDSTTFHRPEMSVFVKTSSTRTRQPESGNGEGLKSLHLGDGVTLIHRHGNEYDDIMPVWDWRTLPGTTTEQANYSLMPPSNWGVIGTSTHAGGVGDGVAGCTAFAYSRLGVAAKKSWFFLGDRMVALGADIDAAAASNPVLTTVNQSLLEGAVTYGNAGTPTTLTTQRQKLASVDWVHHDGLGYYFPSGSGSVTLAGESRTGTWSSINSATSSAPVIDDVFAIHLDHGHPVADASYAYIVVPVDDATSMDASSPDDLVIVRNDAVAQAVNDPSSGYTALNFWAAGTVAGITVDKPCSILVRRDSTRLEITLSDPTQALTGDLMVEIDESAVAVMDADPEITVVSTTGVVRLQVNMTANQGHSLRASLSR